MDARHKTYILQSLRMATVLAVGWLLPGTSNSGEDRTYWNQGLHIAKESEKAFIENGICVSSIDCQQKQLLFLQPTSSGVDVLIYGVIDSKSLEQVTSLCMRMFYANPDSNVSLKVFNESKQMALARPFWNRANPILEIDFSRRK